MQSQILGEQSSLSIPGENLETTTVVGNKRLSRKLRNSRQTHELNGTLDKKRPAAHKKVKNNGPKADEQDEDEKTPVPGPRSQEPQITNAGSTDVELGMPKSKKLVMIRILLFANLIKVRW